MDGFFFCFEDTEGESSIIEEEIVYGTTGCMFEIISEMFESDSCFDFDICLLFSLV